MMDNGELRVLFATRDRLAFAGVEAALREAGMRFELADSLAAAKRSIATLLASAVAMIDARLADKTPSDGDRNSPMKALRDAAGGRIPIVLIIDTVEPLWDTWLATGIVDDLIPWTASRAYWRLRVEMVLRSFRLKHELRTLRETTAGYARNGAQVDPVTGIYNRTALLSLLFRETDRVQRMNSCLTMVLFDVVSEEGGLAVDARRAMIAWVPRLNRLLRSYDLVGEVKRNTYLIALPGCHEGNAAGLIERARAEVFSLDLAGGPAVEHPAVCFGIAESYGRSPLVVLRDAEKALAWAREAGAGAIRSCGSGRAPRSGSGCAFEVPADSVAG